LVDRQVHNRGYLEGLPVSGGWLDGPHEAEFPAFSMHLRLYLLSGT
jgi:hypothetical protein